MNKDLIITDDILIEQYNQNKLIDFVLHSNLFENVKEDSLNVKSLSNFVTFIQDKISNFMFVSFSDFLEYKKCANSVFFMRNILLYLQGKEYQAKPIVKEYLKKQEDIFIELQNKLEIDNFLNKINNLLKSKTLSSIHKKIVRNYVIAEKNMELNNHSFKAIDETIKNQIESFNELNQDYNEKLKNSIFISAQKAYKLNGLSFKHKLIGIKNAKNNNKNGFLFFLDEASTKMLLEELSNRTLRKSVYEKFYNLDKNGKFKKHTKHDVAIKSILSNKQKIAKLFGKDNYAELIFSKFYLNTTEKVAKYLIEIEKQLLPHMMNVGSSIYDLAKKDGIEKLEAWDFQYYINKVKLLQKELTENSLINKEFSNYYDFPQVLQKIKKFLEKQLNLKITEMKTSISQNINGGLLWKIEEKTSKKAAYWLISTMANNESFWYASSIAPLQYINDKDLLPNVQIIQLQINKNLRMSFDDVKYTMHEFGHALMDLFSVNKDDVKDNSKRVLDFLELPSQLLEHMVYDINFMKSISCNKENSKKISVKLLRDVIQLNQYTQTYETFMEVQKYKTQVKVHKEHKLYSKKSPNSLVINDLKKIGLTYNISKEEFIGLNQDFMAYDYSVAQFVYLYSAQIAFNLFVMYQDKKILLKEIFNNILAPQKDGLIKNLKNNNISLDIVNIIEFLKKNNKIKLLGENKSAK
jgi:peptidyl-dipeptidase Dcp